MISYCGVQLSEYPAALQSWVEANFPLDDLPEFEVRAAPPADMPALTFSPPPKPPPVKVGRLHWPRGASRFAVGHYLATTAQLAAIRAQVFASGTTYRAWPFVMDDGAGGVLTTNLYLLPSRPLARCPLAADVSSDPPPSGYAPGLWLLTLVDDRYFWWFAAGAVSVTAGTTTWAQLYSSIGSLLGVTITADAVHADYGKPGAGLACQYRPLPQLLDAVAFNVGQRVVRQPDGTVEALNADTSVTRQQAMSATNLTTQAGGVLDLATGLAPDEELPAVLPSKVTYVFPRNDSTTAAPYVFDVNSTDVDLAAVKSPKVFTGRRTFHDAAYANTPGAALPPTNAATLQTLAKRHARDWYVYRAGWVDRRQAGVRTPQLSGYLDSVEWEQCAPGPGGRPQLATRFRRPPWNDAADELMHNGSTAPASAASLTVQDVNQGTGDSATTVTGVTTLQTDEASGLSAVSVSAGVAKVTLQAASLTHAGAVSTANQEFEGTKAFARGVELTETANTDGTLAVLAAGAVWDEIQPSGSDSGSFPSLLATNVRPTVDWGAASASTGHMRPPIGAGAFVAMPRPDQAANTLAWGFEAKFDGTGFWFRAVQQTDPAAGNTSAHQYGTPVRYDTGGYTSPVVGSFSSLTDHWLSTLGHVYARQGFSTDDGGGTKQDGVSASFVVGGHTYVFRNGILVA